MICAVRNFHGCTTSKNRRGRDERQCLNQWKYGLFCRINRNWRSQYSCLRHLSLESSHDERSPYTYPKDPRWDLFLDDTNVGKWPQPDDNFSSRLLPVSPILRPRSSRGCFRLERPTEVRWRDIQVSSLQPGFEVGTRFLCGSPTLMVQAPYTITGYVCESDMIPCIQLVKRR